MAITPSARVTIFEPVTLGFPSRDRIGEKGYPGVTIGRDAVLRSGTVIYCDVLIGDAFQTGHNVLIREKTTIGDRVAIGTAAVIEGTARSGMMSGSRAWSTSRPAPGSGIGSSSARTPC